MTDRAQPPEPDDRPYEDDPELGGSPFTDRSADAVDDPEADADSDLDADAEDGHAT